MKFQPGTNNGIAILPFLFYANVQLYQGVGVSDHKDIFVWVKFIVEERAYRTLFLAVTLCLWAHWDGQLILDYIFHILLPNIDDAVYKQKKNDTSEIYAE